MGSFKLESSNFPLICDKKVQIFGLLPPRLTSWEKAQFHQLRPLPCDESWSLQRDIQIVFRNLIEFIPEHPGESHGTE